MNLTETSEAIRLGRVSLGVELGSTRIKAVLITNDFQTIATGSFNWENQLKDGIWTYSLEQVWAGIQASYAELIKNVWHKYQQKVTNIETIGISAMMHGYLAFSEENKLLVPFRTWRNNITGEAANALTNLFNFNIPERWSIAHLYQAILNDEVHVQNLDFITTLSGYVHWQLTGEKVLGIGDASGVFPIDEMTGNYVKCYLDKFDALERVQKYSWKIADILPHIIKAGNSGGNLTTTGAQLLDVTGDLQAGSLMAPPEGDAGTGMVGTNSVRKRTGNISVGTSAFSMNVLDKPLRELHKDIDIVSTPNGSPVAMVHTNNCSSDINSWIKLFGEFASLLNVDISSDQLYEMLFNVTMQADSDAGGLLNYSYLSGENITRIPEGRPLFMRHPNSKFSLANFIQAQLYAAFAPLKIGMDILVEKEQIETDVMIAQGGLFRTPVVGQQILADALNMPITVTKNAGEGGPWGMAVLATFVKHKNELNLADFLDYKVFKNSDSQTLNPNSEGIKGYQTFIKKYQAGLPVELVATQEIND